MFVFFCFGAIATTVNGKCGVSCKAALTQGLSPTKNNLFTSWAVTYKDSKIIDIFVCFCQCWSVDNVFFFFSFRTFDFAFVIVVRVHICECVGILMNRVCTQVNVSTFMRGVFVCVFMYSIHVYMLSSISSLPFGFLSLKFTSSLFMPSTSICDSIALVMKCSHIASIWIWSLGVVHVGPLVDVRPCQDVPAQCQCHGNISGTITCASCPRHSMNRHGSSSESMSSHAL